MKTVAFVGNPNVGKTTLFNALTGLRHKVGNYAGVTIDVRSGSLKGENPSTLSLVDLPGLYSLTPTAPDENVTVQLLFGRTQAAPDCIINVVDANNLERNLFLTTQLLELAIPMVIVLTMSDVAVKHGLEIDAQRLAADLGVPVHIVNTSRPESITALVERMKMGDFHCVYKSLSDCYSPEVANVITDICGLVPTTSSILISTQLVSDEPSAWLTASEKEYITSGRKMLVDNGHDPDTVIADHRYQYIGRLRAISTQQSRSAKTTISEHIDAVALHKFWGYTLFLIIIAIVFQAVFTWAQYPADAIANGMEMLAKWLSVAIPPSELRDLLVFGVVGGVGNTVVFLPQILILLFLLGLLEDSGYLARGAVLLDRVMHRVGLHGKSFIPMLSSFACAVPGIMATRTIEKTGPRLLTMFVIPLIPCSARIPVYTMVIATFIPVSAGPTWGKLHLDARGLTMFGLIVLGTLTAFVVAALVSRIMPSSTADGFMLELPPYKLPRLLRILRDAAEQGAQFVKRAGTMILAISIVLWFASTHPKVDGQTTAAYQRTTYAGRIGTLIEPVLKPLGFDWKIGLGLLASVAAREVFIAAMGAIYQVDEGDNLTDETRGIAVGQRMLAQRNDTTGAKAYDLGTGLSLLIFFVFAQQCMSTFAVLKRETNGWKWPLLQASSFLLLAWMAAFLTRQIYILLSAS